MNHPHNLVVLEGKIAGVPRRRYRPDGSPVLQFLLAVENPGGPPEFSGNGLIEVVAFGGLADLDPNLLQKGERFLVQGQLAQRSWRTPEGRHRTLTEVIATRLERVEKIYPATPVSNGLLKE